jgi:hypothetical protein
MEMTDPRLVGRTWPVCDLNAHFDLGHVLNCAVADAIEPLQIGALGPHHAGLWECDLVTGKLIWSGGVYDMFGLERGAPLTRDLALAHYSDHSRSKLESLRSDAIRRGQGFTLDVEIRAAATGQSRRIRIIGAPVCEGEIAVRLHGLKLIV